jgi:hypothetical protein
MIQTTKTVLLLAATFTLATSVLAQAPTDAQRAAIKSNCRSDYMAHCSSISPGGAAALQCLQQNMASLSGACASAVKAVSAPAETKAEPAAAPPAAKEEPKETKAEPAPATEPAKSEPGKSVPAAKTSTKTATGKTTGKPSSAQIAAIRSNCRSDYPQVCSGVPTGGAAALECLQKNKAKLSAACERAVAAAGGGSAAPATASASPDAAVPSAAAPAPLVLRPMLPRERLFVVRSACGADVRTLCANVPVGGGQIIECLASQPAALSPACRDVLGQFAAQ